MRHRSCLAQEREESISVCLGSCPIGRAVRRSVQDHQITLFTLRRSKETLLKRNRRALILASCNEKDGAVADATDRRFQVEILFGEPRQALDEKNQLVTQREAWQTEKKLQVMGNDVLEVKEATVGDDRQNIRSLGGGQQRSRGSHGDAEEDDLVGGATILHEPNPGFHIEALLEAKRYSIPSARSMTPGIEKEDIEPVLTKEDRSLQHLEARTKEPVRAHDRCTAISGTQVPSGQSNAIRRSKDDLFELDAVVGGRGCELLIHGTRAESRDRIGEPIGSHQENQYEKRPPHGDAGPLQYSKQQATFRLQLPGSSTHRSNSAATKLKVAARMQTAPYPLTAKRDAPAAAETAMPSWESVLRNAT